MKKLQMNLGDESYSIYIERGSLKQVKNIANLNRKVLVITDDGVPSQYLEEVISQCQEGYYCIVEQGESSKSFRVYEDICKKLLELDFHRDDLIIALGGGVVGDLAGFVASSYMRGIDFINIPTTTLSQIDSSIGGKTGINLNGAKNIIGSFYQPKSVIIDLDVLETLSKRNYYNGLVEGVKAALIYDKELFEIFEQMDIDENLEEIIYRSLLVKKAVVEKDEKESGLRQILNFGHTIGHGIEGYYNLEKYLHGECVAIGILPMIENKVLRDRTKRIFDKMGIETDIEYDSEEVFKLIKKDKKVKTGKITLVKVTQLGEVKLEKVLIESCKEYLEK